MKTKTSKLQKSPLLLVGAYYKDNLQEGWSCAFNRNTAADAWHIIEGFTKTFESTYYKQITAFHTEWKKSGSAQSWTEFRKAKVQEIYDIDFPEMIAESHMNVFGTPTRGPLGTPKEYHLNEHVLIVELSLMQTVYLLEKEGLIKSDEYNGMSYAYGTI